MVDLLKQIAAIDPGALLGTGVRLIQSHFGTPGVIAAAILGLSVVGIIAAKLLRIAFDILRYVVVPAAGITFIATLFLPFSYVTILPAAVALFSIILILRA